jgi:hypothetical protein
MNARSVYRIRSLAGAVLATVALTPLAACGVGNRGPGGGGAEHAATATASGPVMTDQGPAWTSAARKDFYSRDQGAKLMPLAWITALKQADGSPFMVDSLGRYGYLPNEWSDPPGLPVGFTVAGGSSGETLGITCAACHTRQIEVEGVAYRIDGGPGIVDFQSFLADLDAAVNRVLTDSKAFAAFGVAVLGPSPSRDKLAQLRAALAAWFAPYHTITQRALPTPPWGPARLDAVSMIFNRVAGLDIGPTPTHMIPDNIKPATAPVRYPFLWNAPRQDKTQWPGFADNGDDVLGLARNLGEVYGVFAVFHPKPEAWRLLRVDYLADNTANFHGLNALEGLIRSIGPPQWPWPVNQTLAARGKTVFDQPTVKGGCVECHGITAGIPRLKGLETWHTPIQDVGTDSREYDVLKRTVQTGVLKGAQVPGLPAPLGATDMAFNVLRASVVGSILQHDFPVITAAESLAKSRGLQPPFRPETEHLRGESALQAPAAGAAAAAYESRVLQGIWATAPYLHNGSVPTLAELLKPPAERVAAFGIGPVYDRETVGLAVSQPKFNYVLKTTDCSDRNSGNSRCGHDFGTALTADEKKALLEYLKTL